VVSRVVNVAAISVLFAIFSGDIRYQYFCETQLPLYTNFIIFLLLNKQQSNFLLNFAIMLKDFEQYRGDVRFLLDSQIAIQASCRLRQGTYSYW